MTSEIAARVRAAATKAAEDAHPGSGERVRGMLAGLTSVSFGARLDDLVSRAEVIVPGITGAGNEWRRIVAKARNTLSHDGTSAWMDDSKLDELVTVALSLRWTLRALMLEQAGLSAEFLRHKFASHDAYHHFLEHAAEWQPGSSPAVLHGDRYATSSGCGPAYVDVPPHNPQMSHLFR